MSILDKCGEPKCHSLVVRSVVCSVVKVLPEDVTSEHTIELRLRRGLPLHHNGLICASAGYYVFGWSAGWLFSQHQSTREGGRMKKQQIILYIRAPHRSGLM